MPPRGHGIVRKDYTLLREGQADDLFGDIEAGTKKRGATVWRLFGLARQEVWVRFGQLRAHCMHCMQA